MIEEVLKNIYKIEIPLPGSPLKSINSYYVKSTERNLIIDTGWNRRECMEAMQAGLKQLGAKLEETDFFLTHMHADHVGLVSSLITDTSTVYCSREDSSGILNSGRLDGIFDSARSKGFPENELQKVMLNHPGKKYGRPHNLPLTILKDGDHLRIGEYHFTCVETPGHTKGHMCLYEPDKRILVCGDHILGDITPNIQTWFDDGDPLYEYLSSLDKINTLNVDIALPAHRRIIKDCRQRIQELKDHHHKRLDEVISILKKGRKNGFQVASEMSWDIVCQSWDLFPIMQKWFATGEANAHLQYLKEKGVVLSEILEGNVVYSLQ